MADCLLSIENSPDAMYLCYINQYGTADGYFAFVIKALEIYLHCTIELTRRISEHTKVKEMEVGAMRICTSFSHMIISSIMQITIIRDMHQLLL